MIDRLRRIRNKKSFTNDEINEVLDIIYYAKKQGQKMENRMRKYRSAIESLGFQRKSKLYM
jgi:hypothetical protein